MKQPLNAFPFVAGSYDSRSPKFDCQRTVNLYPEASGSGNSKSIAMLIGTPGTRFWANFGLNGPIRGMLKFSSTYSIIVTGDTIYRVKNDKTFVVLGAIAFASTIVSMASNGTTVMLVDGTAAFYVIDVLAATSVFTVDPSFTGADVVWFLNGRFVWNKPGTQQYQWSELYSTVIDPLAFASAEGAPDLLISLIASHKELWLMGESTIEIHINSGDPDAVFEPIQGAFIEQGCVAKFSVAKMTDGSGTGTIIWLSANDQGKGMFVRAVGYQPQRISDHAFEFKLAGYSRIDDAIAYTYQQEGHSFYVVTFPTANKTWCYDTSTELWHERAHRNDATGALERHNSNCHMFFADLHLVGDFASTNVGSFDLDYYQDDLGIAPIVSIRQCPHLADDYSWQVFHELWIDMETGVGLSVPNPVLGTGYDPSLILEWSDDGGYSFPYSRQIKIGKLGARKLKAVARRLGKSQDRVFRVTVVDPVKRIFLGAGCRTSVSS